MVSTFLYVLSGLLIGAAFGFVLQRGRFCINSAFREVLFQDYTMLRAYMLAVVVTMVGANLIEQLGWLQPAADGTAGQLYRQAFVPWANIIGGYIFGMGIVLAGGCGSGILYLYGPFRFDGKTAESNEAFHQSLVGRDPRWGVRDVTDLRGLGLELAHVVAMPANNHSLVFRVS